MSNILFIIRIFLEDKKPIYNTGSTYLIFPILMTLISYY